MSTKAVIVQYVSETFKNSRLHKLFVLSYYVIININNDTENIPKHQLKRIK